MALEFPVESDGNDPVATAPRFCSRVAAATEPNCISTDQVDQRPKAKDLRPQGPSLKTKSQEPCRISFAPVTFSAQLVISIRAFSF